jgi:alpha-glucosidase
MALAIKPTNEFERKATGKFCDRSICFSKDQEPLYKVVPFIGLQNKQSYGIFFDNTFRTYFDFVTNEET